MEERTGKRLDHKCKPYDGTMYDLRRCDFPHIKSEYRDDDGPGLWPFVGTDIRAEYGAEISGSGLYLGGAVGCLKRLVAERGASLALARY